MVPKKPESMTAMDKLQQFFILHGEKLAFGVVLLVLGWCLTAVFSVETYQHQPEELVTKVQSKRQNFQTNDPSNDESFKQLQVVPYDAQAKQSLAFHVTDIGPFNRGMDVGKKRPVPELLAVADLQARAKQAIVLYRTQPGSVTGNGPLSGALGPAGGGNATPGASPMGPPGPLGGGSGMDLGPATSIPSGGPPGGPASGIPGGPFQGSVPDGGPLNPAGGPGKEANSRGTTGTTFFDNAEPRLRFMVVVTGRIPLEKQLEIYRKAFKDCRVTDPEMDYPNYITFLVERRDLTAGEKQWRKISVRWLLEREVPQWVPAPEVVAGKHVMPLQPRGNRGWIGFTAPLPRLADESWGPEATTHQIMLLSESEKQQGQENRNTSGDLDELFPEDDLFPDQPEGTSSSQTSRPGTPPGYGTQPIGGPSGAAGPAGSAGGMFPPQESYSGGGPVGTGFPGGSGDSPLSPGGSSGTGFSNSLLTRRPEADILLRFIDMNVEPGHEYVYRVKLLLRNPNYGISPRFLVDRDSSKQRILETEWVELLEPVRVTATREVIAGPVRYSPVRDRQSVVVVVRDPDNGARILSELRVYRGQLLNRSVREVFRKHPTHNSVEKLRDFPIRTNMLVLDFMGGQSVPGLGSRPVAVPSQVLVLREDGRLEVRGEVSEDIDAHYELARKQLAELARLARETEGGPSQAADQGNGIFYGPSGNDSPGSATTGGPLFEEFMPDVGKGGSGRNRSRRKR